MSDHIDARPAQNTEMQIKATAEMAQIGVDAAFVDLMVETFYARIRQHETLGPVFESRLSGKWNAHLKTMKGFWSAIAFKTGAYGGKPVQAHHGTEGLREDLFSQWLALFSGDARGYCPPRELRTTGSWQRHSASRVASFCRSSTTRPSMTHH